MTLDEMADRLNLSDDYRVLRRLPETFPVEAPGEGEIRKAVFVDVETTGLDPASDEIIELAMTPFFYGEDGRITRIDAPFEGLHQPAASIPAHITAITGIDDAMVSGHRLDPEAVSTFVTDAALVVAHNAAFDRRFLERLATVFKTKAWACSMTEIDWVAEGFEGAKLAYLAMGAGFFYERHRARHDCAAGIALLAGRLPSSGHRALDCLLTTARRPTWRLWAEGAPFELRDILKARGYRWNADGVGGPKAWYTDVFDEARASELEFLQTEIGLDVTQALVRRITAYDRFSDRC